MINSIWQTLNCSSIRLYRRPAAMSSRDDNRTASNRDTSFRNQGGAEDRNVLLRVAGNDKTRGAHRGSPS